MLNLKEILEGAKMVRNYRTSYVPRKKGNIARVWLEKLVLRTANLAPGDGIIIKTYEDYVHVRLAAVLEMATHKVSRKNGEPLLDICNYQVDRVLGPNIKIDIVVKEGELFIYREMSFEMVDIQQPQFCSHSLRKFRTISLFCGGGAMTSAFLQTGGCESVFAVDIDDPNKNPYEIGKRQKEPDYRAYTVETFQSNFKDTMLFWGDIRSCQNLYIPSADIVCVSPPC